MIRNSNFLQKMPRCTGTTLKGAQCTRTIGPLGKGNYCYQHVNQLPKEKIYHSEDCPICMEVLSTPEITKCGHQFHKQCLDRWKKTANTCPSCRAIICAAPPAPPRERHPATIEEIFRLSYSLTPEVASLWIDMILQGRNVVIVT